MSVTDDPFLWLEDVDSAASQAWVSACNAKTVSALADDQFERDRADIRALLDAPDRIPGIVRYGRLVYNFWRDAEHPKGILRRTTLASYRSDLPEWELVIDVDALARAENEDWVWGGLEPLLPEARRAVARLSRGGADAVVLREFDLVEKRFVTDGFTLPEAKGSVSWVDDDTLLVSSALGGEDAVTTSGYARTVRLWRRGTPFETAAVVFAGEREDMSAGGYFHHAQRRLIIVRRPDFFTQHYFYGDLSGTLRRLEVPDDATVSLHANDMLVSLRSDWTVADARFPEGALLAIDLRAFLAGDRNFDILFAPTPRHFLQHYDVAGDTLAITSLDNVRSRIMLRQRTSTGWSERSAPPLPAMATAFIGSLDPDSDAVAPGESPAFLISTQSPIDPLTLLYLEPGRPIEILKRAPALFDATGMVVTQHEALSEDGTRVPYFQIGRADPVADASPPVLMSGYGGFEISSLPYYSPEIGKLWLARGGVYVIANIRGGGEFGPAWHKAGIREGKKSSHDDFAAVARDLVARGVTSRARLAARGGSNGGLLIGNMLTRYPHLFGALVCAVPLLDMRRYTKLLAGASWIGEYGDPDKPDDWAFLHEVSAYQNAAADLAYPPILLTTSARDDRVHPGHARKMAAKLMALGQPVQFYEPAGGGHAGAADNAQVAFNTALAYAFLRHTIAPEMAGDEMQTDPSTQM